MLIPIPRGQCVKLAKKLVVCAHRRQHCEKPDRISNSVVDHFLGKAFDVLDCRKARREYEAKPTEHIDSTPYRRRQLAGEVAKAVQRTKRDFSRSVFHHEAVVAP